MVKIRISIAFLSEHLNNLRKVRFGILLFISFYFRYGFFSVNKKINSIIINISLNELFQIEIIILMILSKTEFYTYLDLICSSLSCLWSSLNLYDLYAMKNITKITKMRKKYFLISFKVMLKIILQNNWNWIQIFVHNQPCVVI